MLSAWLLAPALDSTAFFGKPEHTYLLDDYVRFPTMEEVKGKIIAYDPLKVEKLEVVTERHITGGNQILAGIVSYTTYKGEGEGFPLEENLYSLPYEGLQLQREFYSPVYPTEQQHSRMPDFRNLLHWAPEIRTKAGIKDIISFYTSDLKGKFVVVVQGISPGGHAGAKTIYFEVADGAL